MEFELIERTGSNPEEFSDANLVVLDGEDFYTAYYENGRWVSNDTQDGWFNRPLKNVTRWFEIRRTPLAPDRAKRAAKSKPSASKRSKSGAAGKA